MRLYWLPQPVQKLVLVAATTTIGAARYAKVKFDDAFARVCPLVVFTVSVTV